MPIEEGLEFIRAADPMVDLWDVVIGSMWGPGRLDSGPSRFFDQGYQMTWSGRAREATEKPIVVVGRFTDPDRMANLVRGGTVDLIGAARPSISDPFLPQKIEQGRYDEIRECIGCNACYSRSIWGRHLGCTQNATAGEEYRRGWHPERFDRAANADRAVLVVGAGPAGMECATVLGKRGMELVHLVDAADDIGGCMSWITRMPGLGTWGHVVDYRRAQIDRLDNVSLGLGTRLSAADVLDYGAQIVVVATGSHWAGDGISGVTRLPIPGADSTLPHVLTPEQVMVEGKRPPGSRVAVVDYEGYFVGSALAEQLRSDGLRGRVRDQPRGGRALLRSDARGPAGAGAAERDPGAGAPGGGGRPDRRGRDRSGGRVPGDVAAGGGRRGAGHAAAVGRGAVPRAGWATGLRWRRPGSRRSTGSATASRRA